MNVCLLIPALNPDERLIVLLDGLSRSPLRGIVVVDDGSAEEFSDIFQQAGRMDNVTVLRHSINMGKGAALKTGLRHVMESMPDAAGVVTLDADGQHLPEDAVAVAKAFLREKDCMVLGSRDLADNTPFRSRLGNVITRHMSRLLCGLRVSDTQTGLRAIPRGMTPALLEIPFDRYDFEMEMLIRARRIGINIIEQRIGTVYIEGNPSSHFNPLLDSMRICLVLVRHALSCRRSALPGQADDICAEASLFRIRAEHLCYNAGKNILSPRGKRTR